jgi:pimeloyl-ACP methyl ester carboxylesterase
MIEPHTRFVQYVAAGRFRRMSLRCFGNSGAPPLLCVHGLTRNARDFDVIAQVLSEGYYVVSPDLPGRGGSDWLEDPMLYTTETYVTALTYVMSSLGEQIDYIGTSLGGICGMELAALPGHPIRRMVLNDVGPLIPKAALERIRDYLCGPVPRFTDYAHLKLYLRRVHAAFGPLTDAQWLTLAQNSARGLPDGSVALHYDPAISVAYAADPITDLDMRHLWQRIDIPMLTLRGEFSDLLTADIADTMAAKSRIHSVPNTGHAPALLDAATIEVVRGFLAEG